MQAVVVVTSTTKIRNKSLRSTLIFTFKKKKKARTKKKLYKKYISNRTTNIFIFTKDFQIILLYIYI